MQPHTINQWTLRLQYLRQRLVNGRQRRGLINAGGWILNKVFGTATEKQIMELKELLKQGRIENHAITHHVNNMVSVINTLQTEENKTREFINEDRRLLGSVVDHLTGITQILNNTTVWIEHTKTVDDMNGYFIQLESRHREVQRIMNYYHLQRMQLEAGRLTEDILKIKDLMDILTKVNNFRLKGTAVDWYYEHCLVHPVLDMGQRLAYFVEIPLVARDVQRVVIHAYPTMTNEDTWIKLSVQQDIGYDHKTGEITTLAHCIGGPQTLCEAKLSFMHGLECERAIIMNDADKFPNCRIQSTPETTYAEQLSINNYAVVTTSTRADIRCEGKPTITKEFRPGVLHINFGRLPCQVEGNEGFLIRSKFVNQFKKEYQPVVVNTSLLILPEFPALVHLDRSILNKLNRVEGVSMHSLSMIPSQNWSLPISHQAWGNTLMLALVVIVSIVIGIYVLLPRIRSKLSQWKQKRQDLPESSTTKPTNDVEMTERPAKMYPDLFVQESSITI